MLKISGVRFTAGNNRERRTGLLGYVSFVNRDGLRLDGITLRRTANGRLALSYPERTDGHGRSHPIIRPVDAPARLALEREVLSQLAVTLEGGT